MKKKHHVNLLSLSFELSIMILLSFLPLGPGWAQSSSIKKSDKIETIDGKKFFIHSVEKGQTLYSISKTYGTTVDIILANNQDAIDGLKSGDRLKIPYSGNTEAIKKEIEKQTALPQKPEKDLAAKPSSEDTTKKRNSENKSRSSQITSTTKEKKAEPAPPVLAAVPSIPEEAVKPIGDIHVALFLPLDLALVESMDVGKIVQGEEKMPEETKSGIEFYEGIKMAFDSLKKQGFQGYLHVYDSNLDSAAFIKVMKNPELKEMDLIIGPLYGKRFDPVLKFAKENKINIVSPNAFGNNMLLGNAHASKVTPSYVTQTEELAKYTAENFAGQNIIIFNSANPKDKAYLNTFKRIANPILQKSKADTVKEITFVTLSNFISKTKPNIVVIPSTNQSFVTEAANKLFLHKQESKDSIIALGFSNFQDIESLDFGYLNSLHAIISSYSFVDYTNTETKRFIQKYRDEYKTEPSSHVFSGFDVGYFYLEGLQKYGNTLQHKLPELKQKGIQTEFNFYQSDINSGYENKGVGIMKFENFSYSRVK